MARVSQATGRTEYDFSGPTFDVLVGKDRASLQTFTAHSKILTKRSKFFRAARKPEWLNDDINKPVDLTGEDPEVFQAYLGCVYRGPETLREMDEGFEREVRQRITGISEIDFFGLDDNENKQTVFNTLKKFGKINEIEIMNLDDYEFPRPPVTKTKRFARVCFTTTQAACAAVEAYESPEYIYREIKTFTVEFARDDSGMPHEEVQQRRYEVADPKYTALIKLYVLADKLGDLITANMVVDTIYELFGITKVHPGPVPMTLAYRLIVEGDGLRRMLFDLWAERTDELYCPDRLAAGGFPKAFLQDLAVGYTRDLRELYENNGGGCEWAEEEYEQPYEPDLCDYHQHDNERPSCFQGLECCHMKYRKQ